jgi:tRNA A-37 threonylcarbamoyl transferase component Bud32
METREAVTSLPLRRIEGKYEILEKLGEGGMGAVYKVRHRLLDTVRVIKMMRPQLVEDEGLKARFLREARVATQLRHPNIAQLYDFTIDEGVASIVMEYVPGATLESVVRSGVRPPLGLALEIAQQSLRALAYLHGKGFVHRDISPDNLMLAEGPDGEPQVKLIDLGIAKTLSGGATGYLTQAGTFLGKLRYSPPEQFDAGGASAVDARGDLYSFGLVLYELLTGRYPIRGRDPSALIAGHLFWAPLDFAESDPEGAVPPDLRAAILKSLAKKPEERFASAQELHRALAALRSPSDLPEGELQRVLGRAAAGGGRAAVHDPGSTQNRLDFQFGLGTTPSPPRLVEVKEAPPAPIDEEARRRAIAALAEGFEAKLGRGDFHAAELLLFDAEVEHGEQEAFAVLHERLAEGRRREREAKAEARRRGEAIATAIAEIEDRLAKGDLDRAGEVLDGTVFTYGEDTVSRELRSRVGELRREAREAERSALLGSARERLAAGDLAAAEAAVGHVEQLDPESPAARALREEIAQAHRRREEEARRQEARRAALAVAVAGIAARLEAPDLGAAESALGEALEAFGEEEPLRALRSRLGEEQRRVEREAEAAARVESARGRCGVGYLDGAEEDLDGAEALVPGLAAARALREEVARARQHNEEEARRRREEEARERHEAEARQRREEDARQRREEEARRRREEKEARRREEARRAALAAAVAGVAAQLEARELGAAESALGEALEAFGEEKPLRALSARLDEERRRAAREAKLAAALESAGRRLGAGDLDGALDDLGAAEGLDPANAAARGLRDEVLAERRRREEEARREAERAAAIAAIDALLEQGDLGGAAGLLPEAAAEFGEDTLLRHRRQRIEELGRRAEEERRERELAASLAAIDGCLGEGRLDEAARLLPGAVAAFGGLPALRERWERLERLRREAAVAVLLARATSQLDAGEHERAARTLRQALDLEPQNRDAEALMHRARERR